MKAGCLLEFAAGMTANSYSEHFAVLAEVAVEVVEVVVVVGVVGVVVGAVQKGLLSF